MDRPATLEVDVGGKSGSSKTVGEGRGGSGLPARGFRIGRWLGIEIRLEGSWFIIFTLLLVSFAGNLAVEHPGLSLAVRWSAALGASLLFFGSILLHEMAHSVTAQKLGLRVHGITLLLFGGVSHLGGEPRRPKDDLAIAVVGPLASAAIGAFFLAVAAAASSLPVARSIASWLGFINLGLAAFNMLPGFPLDGGRVLKAALWAATGNPDKAYRMAIAAGRSVAYGMILTGVILAFGLQRTVDGLWIAFMGWYLLSGAQSMRAQLSLGEVLRSHRVRDVLRPPAAVVQAQDPLAELVEEWILRRGHRALFVCAGRRLKGLVTLHEIKPVPREAWAVRTAGEIMIPVERLATVLPDEPLLQAFRRMDELSVHQLPAVAEGELVGVVTREDILRLLAVRAELGGPQAA